MVFSQKGSSFGFLSQENSQSSRFRTYVEANATSRAPMAYILGGCVALFVQFQLDGETMNRASEDAQPAAFA
jgi:hypothetical protein